jgi:Flp pilus assembly protein TadG
MPLPGRHDRGQTLPLFAIVAPIILAFMALGLDTAHAFLERRDAQGAADLAALAGARLLHDGATVTEQANARAKAVSVAVANGYAASQVTAITPYDGDDEKIRVVIDSGVRTVFAPVLDLIVGGSHASTNVDAGAVAYGGYEETGGGEFAILALEGCPSLQKTLDFSGSTIDVIGRVHSNSDLYISGSTNDFVGQTSYVCPLSGYPRFHNGGSGNTFTPTPGSAPAELDPVAKARSYFTPCTYTASSSGMWDLSSNGSWWVGGTKVSKTLRPGIYCSGTGSSDGIKLSDSDIRVLTDIATGADGVTFVASYSIEVSGSNFQLKPFKDNILFASYGTSDVAVKVAGSGGTWEGIIYAPNGTAEISGSSNLALQGGIIAKRVKLNGSGFSIDGSASEGGPGEQVIALTE